MNTALSTADGAFLAEWSEYVIDAMHRDNHSPYPPRSACPVCADVELYSGKADVCENCGHGIDLSLEELRGTE